MNETIKDGLVIPPGEKSEAEYRAKIARGEVRVMTFCQRLTFRDGQVISIEPSDSFDCPTATRTD